jgi:hypothetical protein
MPIHCVCPLGGGQVMHCTGALLSSQGRCCDRIQHQHAHRCETANIHHYNSDGTTHATAAAASPPVQLQVLLVPVTLDSS